ncbi:hypothetical protein QC762_508555 [Podospora pseudocomata]|uniref:Uncharacterized protein n=1 Tax=Podospora pseudocomata TaxID=2093779 RepID=A0ABR0GD39_9PEZI|nr:hypothetical protein QC762_508555 [Podospora pseudocomata]
MCTYTTHVRVCGSCRCEDTVLISEKLCPVAQKANGIFGACLEGVLSERDATRHWCWQCKESVIPSPPPGYAQLQQQMQYGYQGRYGSGSGHRRRGSVVPTSSGGGQRPRAWS